METSQIMDNDLPSKKVYKERVFVWGTYLGGPLVAGYLLAENFKAFGKPEFAKKTWIIVIIGTVALGAAIVYIPALESVPKSLVPVIYVGATIGVVQGIQKPLIEKHQAAGGQFHSVGRVILVVLAGIVLTAVPVFLALYFS